MPATVSFGKCLVSKCQATNPDCPAVTMTCQPVLYQTREKQVKDGQDEAILGTVQVYLPELQLQDSTDSLAEIRAC